MAVKHVELPANLVNAVTSTQEVTTAKMEVLQILVDEHGIKLSSGEKEKFLARLKERFYWPSHQNDVSDWCANCPSCAARKTPTPKAQAPLKIIQAGYPQQIVAVDIVGPFTESEAGNRYILVASDYFMLWVEAYPIPNLGVVTVAC